MLHLKEIQQNLDGVLIICCLEMPNNRGTDITCFVFLTASKKMMPHNKLKHMYRYQWLGAVVSNGFSLVFFSRQPI